MSLRLGIVAVVAGIALALPALAQDFRGVRPGDPISDLDAFGPYLRQIEATGGLLGTLWESDEFGTLNVLHEPGGRVMLVETWGDGPLGQLNSQQTTLAEVVAMAGSEGWAFDGNPAGVAASTFAFWTLAWPLPDDIDSLLTFTFVGQPPGAADAEGHVPLDAAALLVNVAMLHSDYLTLPGNSYGNTLVPRPGALPFAMPLDALLTP